jgi:proteasome accessory factor C
MGRPSAVTNLARLLAMIPWIAAHDGPTVDEVCLRFDIGRKQLLADLDVLPFVGLYPYTPDQLVEVLVEDDRVWIRYAPMFERPLRLTPDQALALVAAGSTLLAVPGAERDGPLARGLAKLRAVLGITADAAVEVVLGAASAEVLDLLQASAHEHVPVQITYYAHNRDERTERVIEPWRVFADQGQWYVQAWCRSAMGERLFRVDRIESARRETGSFEHPVSPEDLGVFSPDADDPRIVLELEPAAQWVIEQYPVETVEDAGDGRRRVTLAVSAAPWLARLLLRLGHDARIVTAPTELADVGRDAAARILARYRT